MYWEVMDKLKNGSDGQGEIRAPGPVGVVAPR